MEAFADYISATKAKIKAERQRYNQPCDKMVVDMNAPFELRPESKVPAGEKYQKGVLLVHGFLDSPYTMRSVAKIYQSQGFLVRSVLLPGHGSDSQALRQVSVKDWQGVVDYGLQSLSQDSDEIHVCGFSLGGALACLAMEKHKLASLCLLAPALKLSKISTLALPILHGLSQIKWLAKLDWINIKGQPADLVRYNSFPVLAGKSVTQLVAQAKAQLDRHPIKIPLFIVATCEDETVKFSAIYKVFKQAKHFHKAAVIFSTKQDLHHPGVKVIKTKNSHIGLPVAPEDPYLGKEYSVKATKEHLHYHRLTYNPDFRALREALINWL